MPQNYTFHDCYHCASITLVLYYRNSTYVLVRTKVAQEDYKCTYGYSIKKGNLHYSGHNDCRNIHN